MIGKYILIEGGDGTGKSTLLRAVYDRLVLQRKVVLVEFPDANGAIGGLIRRVLNGDCKVDGRAMMYLFFADAVDREPWIQQKLAEGYVVLSGRHSIVSGRVYQPERHARSAVAGLHDSFQFTTPNQIFLLNLTAEESAKRVKLRDKVRDEMYEKDDVEYTERIRQRYLSVVSDLWLPFVVLDASKPIDELVNLIVHKGTNHDVTI